MLIGCATRPEPVVIDTGDFERLRYEFEQLRGEYDRLQSDYQRLTAESQFYADYYRYTTEAIAKGLEQLEKLGTDNIAEIARLRGYIAILKNIIVIILAGEQGEGSTDTSVDAN
jgi:hypothetical protein